MGSSIKSLYKNVSGFKKKNNLIKPIKKENYELSDSAKLCLKEARETSEDDYIDL